ncbi:MAG TPA: GtrA family protein [Methanobacterium sp.]|jgi:putative flippase GtrA|nr:GtrA family protein [Methanobacterium sp.]
MITILKNLTRKLVREQTDKILIQFIRYFVVGGTAFIVDIGSLYIFTEYFGIYYLISASLAFILGLITNYLLSISWVFNKRTLDSKKIEFGVFTLIGIVGLALNGVLIWFFTEYLQIYYMLSKIIAAAIILSWNFAARRFILFR